MDQHTDTPQPIFKAPDLPPTPPEQPPQSKSNPFLILVVALGMLAVGLGGGYYYAISSGTTKTPVVSPTVTAQISVTPIVTPVTEASSSPLVYNTTLCTNEALKLQIDVPDEFNCVSSDRSFILASKYFDITISDLGRGGPCPLYMVESEADAAPRCTTTLLHSNSLVTVNIYKEGDTIDSIFGEVGKATPEQSMTWIDIVNKANPDAEPTGAARNELILLLDNIKPL